MLYARASKTNLRLQQPYHAIESLETETRIYQLDETFCINQDKSVVWKSILRLSYLYISTRSLLTFLLMVLRLLEFYLPLTLDYVGCLL
jgi:hypothetical protein